MSRRTHLLRSVWAGAEHGTRVPAALLLASVVTVAAPSLRAQTTATVTVNAGTALATISPNAFGINTAVWDSVLTDTKLPGLISGAGITAMRYPGGSTSDTYNWQTDTINPNLGGYANPTNNFDNFMTLAKSAGATPVITVNYGSDTAGTGGGTPAFAAAWVQYSNITKGYGVKYWEVGNEVYGNGEYGGAWETDLHAAHDPTTYGSNVALFASAMKAVDPTIKVGAVLTAPGNWPDGQTPNWNTNVLAQCGTDIDFVIVHWYPQNPGSETDAGLLQAPQGGTATGNGIATMVSKVRSLIATYGGANAANIQILVTEMNSVSSNEGKQTVSPVNALFVADGLVSWLENGVTNVDIWDLYNGANTSGNNSSSLYGTANYGDYGILSSGGSVEPALDTAFPTYYAFQMLTALGRAGDTLVSSSSSNSLLSVHAVKQAGGNLALLLINKDPSNTDTASVSVAGYTPAATGTTYSYGKASTAITSAAMTGLGSSFSVATPPYSLTTIVMTPASASQPSYTLSANPTGLTVAQGGSGASTITVAPSGGFTGSVAFTISGLPAGVTASFSPASSTSATTLTLHVASTAALGSSVMTITGTSGTISKTTTLSLAVTAAASPSFSLSASPASGSVVQGGSASTTISVAPANGFTGSVALAASSLPSGVTASFSPASTTGKSTLTLTAGAAATTGAANITITGTSGTLSKTVTLPLTVTAAPSFSLSATPSSLSVTQGASAATTVSVSPANGFTGAVALAATGLPSGVTASFSPASTTGTSTLTLAAAATASAGAATITVTGTSAAVSKTVTLPVTVSAAASGGGPVTVKGVASSTGAWFDEDDVDITSTAPITAMTLTTTVPSANVTFGGIYNTVGGQVVNSHSSSTSIVYTFTLTPGQTIGAGSFTFAAQMDGNGTTHNPSLDSWTLTYTAGGTTYTQSGSF